MDLQTDRQRDKWTYRQIDREINGLTDRQTDKWTYRQIDRQINGLTDRQIDSDSQI